MSQTAEAAWRRRTRTPALLVTACAWVAAVEVAALTGPGMGGMHGPGAAVLSRAGLLSAALMVASMMTPLTIPAVRHTAVRSLRGRRWRSVTLLVLTHAGLWVLGGIGLQLVALWLLGRTGGVAAPLTGVAIALVWHMSPTAQRCGNQHHVLPPLAAFGASADGDVVSYGARHAAYCLGACWPLMLLPALCGSGQVVVMAICSAWVWAQAMENPTHPRWRLWLPRRPGRLVRGLAR
jgi:predicted metal-binding membrane protein